LLNNFIYTVPAGSRGLIIDRINGVSDEVYGEGTHFMVPVKERVQIMNARINKFDIKSNESQSKDMQLVNLKLRVLYRPVEAKLPYIYDKLGVDFAQQVLPSVGNEVLKAVVARYNADQLLSQRKQVSDDIRSDLIDRLREYGIRLDDVSLTHLTFSREFSRAIEDKQVAQQKSERAKYLVERAEQDRIRAVVTGSADAEAAQLVSDAIAQHGRGLIEIRRIETAQSLATTLAKSRAGITYLPKNGNMLLNLPGGR
jgi:prohibitin 1